MTIHTQNTQNEGISTSGDTKFSFRAMLMKAFSGMHFSRLKYRSWRTKSGMLLVLAAIISGFATYAALTETPPFGDDPNLVIWLLNLDLIILILLVSLIAWRIVGVWSGKKRGLAGSHLHVRLVYIFSILVAVPTIVMTVFSAFFFHFGIQAWFSQRVQTAVNESQAVAQSYLAEHKEVIRADTMAMANDIDRFASRNLIDEKELSQLLDTQVFYRKLSEAIVIHESKQVIARSSLSFTLEYEPPTNYEMTRADNGDVILIMNEDQDRVRALVRLQSLPDAYLFVGRMIDPKVISHLNASQLAVEDYQNLQTHYSTMQITVTMIFVLVGLLLLLAAIWSGLLLARELVNPIGELILAAERVRAGDFSMRLPETKRLEEFEYLARSFNRMTTQIQTQRDDLIDANRQIDRRRRLTETVLTGVSSGVIGVDGDGIVNLANTSAIALLDKPDEEITGQYILELLPEINPLLRKVAKRPQKMMQEEVPVISKTGGKRTFLFRVSIEILDESDTGLIITFDDITELQSAQRKAAWSDVARRIAHEIKNPLTPIQLSAERLKRKYLKDIEGDKETFEQCTDTILKHVSDIGRMVDEFSSFARMPEPIMKPENLIKHVKDDVILAKQGHEKIKVDIVTPPEDIIVNMDNRQIRQVITNLIKNAAESIEEKLEDTTNGKINVIIGNHGDDAYVAITDNGAGFPENQDLTKLTDPYITHKTKGTGLGLAIVKKIIEDHEGKLILGTTPWLEQIEKFNDLGGATIIMTFPLTQKQTQTEKQKENAE